MREILFRGKRCDNDEWVQGYYIRADHHWHKHGIHKDWITLGASANGGWFALHNKYAVKAETVGQYTGLTDKNGKKIFEGDIIDASGEWWDAAGPAGHDSPVIAVEWDDGLCGFAPFAVYDCDCDVYINASGVEVIGNIHDNPELLEVE